MITAKKRWLVVAPSGLSDTKIILAKASTKAQIRAIGRQTGDGVGFFLQSDSFATDCYTMRAAGVVFEETPRQDAYGWVAVWRDPSVAIVGTCCNPANPPVRAPSVPNTHTHAQDRFGGQLGISAGTIVTIDGKNHSSAKPRTWITTNGATPR